MAQISVVEDKVMCKLSISEKIGAFHKSPVALLSSLVSVKIYENPWSGEVLKGMRAPGTAVPFVILLGTMRYRGGKDFCALHGRKPVFVLEFKDSEFKRWIVSTGEELPKLVQAKVGDK